VIERGNGDDDSNQKQSEENRLWGDLAFGFTYFW
jgi:hypothetical protein